MSMIFGTFILEGVRRSLPAVFVVITAVRCAFTRLNVAKMPNCFTPDAFLKLEMHQNSFSAPTLRFWTPLDIAPYSRLLTRRLSVSIASRRFD